MYVCGCFCVCVWKKLTMLDWYLRCTRLRVLGSVRTNKDKVRETFWNWNSYVTVLTVLLQYENAALLCKTFAYVIQTHKELKLFVSKRKKTMIYMIISWAGFQLILYLWLGFRHYRYGKTERNVNANEKRQRDQTNYENCTQKYILDST